MNSPIPIFWIIMLIFWILSSLAKKKAETAKREEYQSEDGEEDYNNKPEEAIESFLRKITGEEEIKITPPPFKPLTETVKAAPPYYQPEIKKEDATLKVIPSIKKKEKKAAPASSLLGRLDMPSVRRGIIMAEILGPPRSEKPL